MKLTITDVASLGLLVCGLVVTGFVVRRDNVVGSQRAVVLKVEPRPELQLVGRVIGRATASVPVVFFGDFQCPYCARAQDLTRDLLAAFPNDMKVVYRHLPLETIHPHAWDAAVAAECAGEQGRFAPYHDLLYALQDSIGKLPWLQFALRAGVLDTTKFQQCLADGRTSHAIERDVLLARDLGLTGTPAFVVGDEVFLGVPSKQWIERRVRRAVRRAG